MDTTFQRLTRAIGLLPQRERTLRLAMLLTLTRPHELLDPRTGVEQNNLVVGGRRRVPLGAAAATVLGGPGRVRGLLGIDAAAGQAFGRTGDGPHDAAREALAAAALRAAVEAAHTTELRSAVTAYAGLTTGAAALQPVADLLDQLARGAGYHVPTTTPQRHLDLVTSVR